MGLLGRSSKSSSQTNLSVITNQESSGSSRISLLSRFSRSTKSSKTSSAASSVPPQKISQAPVSLGKEYAESVESERAKALAKLTCGDQDSSIDDVSFVTSDADDASTASTVVLPLRSNQHKRSHSKCIVKENQLFQARMLISELLGAGALKRKATNAPIDALQDHHSARELWLTLYDGVILVRLLTRLGSNINADHRDVSTARKNNIAKFLHTIQLDFNFHPDDLFQTDDLLGGSEEGFAAVVHCLAHFYLQIGKSKIPTRGGRISLDAYQKKSARISQFVHPVPIDPTRKGQSLYGLDRRMSESAIDIMSSVQEWDENRQGGTPTFDRPSSPLASPTSSLATSPKSPVAEISAGSSNEDSLGKQTKGANRPSRPPRSVLRPPNALKRSLSVPAALEPPNRSEDIPFRNGRPLSATSVSSIPFPSSPEKYMKVDGLPSSSPIRPRHNRWNSELHPTSSRTREFASRTTSTSIAGKRSSSEPRAKPKIVVRDASGTPIYVYQLGEVIGRGQFGTVYRALNLLTGAVVAVKRIKLAGKSEDEISQLATEVEVLKKCLHPSVVRYEGLVRTEHYLNLILEFVENGSLLDTIKAFGEFPESLVASYVVKILEGLSYLHANQVVHCDLKCANILTTKSGNVKIGDFGVSLNLNAVHHSPEISGTPCWIAPEVILLQGASTASDIWSLGCTIIEMISGKPPYSDLISMTAMFRIVEDDLPPIPPTCSPELYDFLLRCFAKEPKERPSATDLFDHIWLQKNFDRCKEYRPQDSIPFLKRMSTEMRRLDASSLLPTSSSMPLLDRAGLSLDSIGRLAASPQHLSLKRPDGQRRGLSFDLPHEEVEALRLDLNDVTKSTKRPSMVARHSSKSTSGKSIKNVQQRAHSLVKTNFSKAVECKICRSSIKRHGKAFLCEACGLICHNRCAEFAVSICDLRASLMHYSNDPYSRSMSDIASSFPKSNSNVNLPVNPLQRDLSSDSSSSGSVSAPIFSPGLLQSNISLATTIAAGDEKSEVTFETPSPTSLSQSLPNTSAPPRSRRRSARLNRRTSGDCLIM